MRKLTFLPALVVLLIMVACSSSNRPELQKETVKDYSNICLANWLLGEWENNSEHGFNAEYWTKMNDSTYRAVSFMVVDGDTVSKENITLEERNDSLWYIPVVKNQNEGLPVYFAMKQINDSVLVFENFKHDYPQRISYRRINPDSIVAEISAPVLLPDKKMTFPLSRN